MKKRKHLLLALVSAVVVSAVNVVPAAVSPAKIIPNAGAPVGIGATTTQLLYSQPFCQTVAGTRVLNSVNPVSNAISLFATLPNQFAGADLFTTCAENYFAISTGLGGFPADYVYVSVVIGGADVIVQVNPTTKVVSLFAALPVGFSSTNHAGVTFDTTGTFGYALIVTGNGGVIGYNATGTILFQYPNPNPGAFALEGATVAPLSYGLCPGCLFLVATGTLSSVSPGAIYTVVPGSPSGTLPTFFSSAPHEPEGILFVPAQPCSFGGYAYFVSGFHTPPGTGAFSTNGAILAYTAAQLAPYAGQFLIPDEGSGIIYAFSAPGVFTVFSNTNYQLEGATLAQCAPATGCPATQGFWKHHPFPASLFTTVKSGQPAVNIGGTLYTAAELVNILNTPPKGGNAVLIMGHQLIAALANVAAGAQVTPAAALAISQAELLLKNNGLTLYSFVKASTALGQQMTALADILDAYNNGVGLNCREASGLTTG